MGNYRDVIERLLENNADAFQQTEQGFSSVMLARISDEFRERIRGTTHTFTSLGDLLVRETLD